MLLTVKKMTISKEAIKNVHKQLKNGDIYPSGAIGRDGYWYAEHEELIDSLTPSKDDPFAHIEECKELYYVEAVAEFFECESEQELIRMV